MKREGIILILSLLLFSCSPQSRLNRLIKNHPELSIKDTVKVIDTLIIPELKFDTVFRVTNNIDTFYVDKENIKFQIIKNDSIIKVKFFIPADTIIKTLTVPVEKIKVVKEDHFLEWLKWIALSLGIVALIIFLLRKLT